MIPSSAADVLIDRPVASSPSRARELFLPALWLAMVALPVPGLAQKNAVPPSLLGLNLELVDTSGEVTDQREDHERRLAAVREILAGELAARDVYAVVDAAPIQDRIDAARKHQYLHACNGCEIRFAREVDANRVLTGHVRKVSSLIMALWIDIKDAGTGRPILRKVLDFRGDTDQAWQRAALYLARELEQLAPEDR
jgi:Protein of unknown function (DUF2380)